MGEMTHNDIDQQEIVEGYVRHKLSPERRSAFEEHFFACDECFDKVQSAERFVTGVRYAAEAGLLAREIPGAGAAKPLAPLAGWLRPALALSAAVSVVLAGALAWVLFYRAPQLRAELARERDQQERIRQEDQQKLDRTSDELNSEIARRTEVEKQLADLQAVNQGEPRAQTEANAPVIMLEAERSNETPIVVSIPSGARSLIFVNQPGPGPRFRTYRIEVDSGSHKRILAVEGLKKGADGMLTLILPASAFGNGLHFVKLYGIDRGRAELAGEYSINIRKS